ncbi:tRNA (adenosine(37)-N6)-threonylcarbamoyltransferase complex dimerization subunit type 1 TsaB [Rarobacter faecitabidus]|uniref:tRNA threonylcarbamoyladenosine biosynthesis protein TsaB n=1 Tax=Rarobacter faecitabidus TaxID=13243 RepID=A0A542ZXG5_RARFA|nr:tRNA (adenosine(37)-N6)-threonylcarbamoyltransferase complex dimerization subunit type 1 TsaB [Rarobacter faecitabidus]TQL65048.1 tRNA threonylcarbamoyladenosine biosynthesis protein TsaB [Rarobacter faecitabidus]
MPTLALDTSSGIAVAIVGQDGPLAAARLDSDRQHAERLSPLIASALADARLRPADIDRVVVGTGPAPFTGLRAGLVAARTFAYARGIPVFGVCSLDAVALSAAEQLTLPVGTRLLVLSDARRKEVYARRYRIEQSDDAPLGAIPIDAGRSFARAGEPWVSRPAEISFEDESSYVVASPTPIGVLSGSGIGTDRSDLGVDPALLVRVADADLAAGADLPADPLYLRRPDAQVPGPAKKAG